jgi:hypothetical protein
MRVRLVSSGVCVVFCAAVSLPPLVVPAAATAPGQAGERVRQAGSIAGTALRHDHAPMAGARVRLRDLTTGRVVGGTATDAQGRFSFDSVPAGSYTVELVDDRAVILAVGQRFSVRPGEPVTTLVRVARGAVWYDGFFGNAATAVLAAAASLGFTALGDGVRPASPRF